MSGKKFLILHNFGGVGKSTVAGCLIHPRIGGEILSIESNNLDAAIYGLPVRRYAATQYSDFYGDLRRYSVFGNTITDVGASNVEAFVDHLIQSGGHEQFDYVVVPATQGIRGETETITTLQTLLDSVGFAPARIRVVLNMVEKATRKTPIETHFRRLFGYAMADGRFQLNPKCWIPRMGVFSILASANRTWSSVVTDQTDYDAKIKEARDAQKKRDEDEAVNNALLQQMVRQAAGIMNDAWNAMNIDIAAAPAPETRTEQLEQ